jgi:hypothetical protein
LILNIFTTTRNMFLFLVDPKYFIYRIKKEQTLILNIFTTTRNMFLFLVVPKYLIRLY